ncbi:MAG: c-type cytochrome biogenesis protein CcsB [Thermodesulfobacteriota bacterium]|nr:MAG: c-type cytochrome biogenesis protein CcsB [Thermodesulfobacteriota bacterium]
MSNLFFHIAVIAYLVATFVYIGYLIVRKEPIIRVAQWILIGGFAFHTLTLISRWFWAGRTPITNLHESLTFFSWITVALYMVILVRYKMRVLGAFITPFAFVLIITASFFPSEIVPLAPALKSYWLPVHVVLAFLGNAFFALAFFLGVMYMIQERYLKRRQLKGLYYILPSLELLDELNYRCLQYGFPLLTLAMITGAIWSDYMLGSYWLWQPRQIWSLITWFLYAALLHGRLTSGWRGRKAAILSSTAFMVLIGSFFIINFAMGGAHGIK